jgi:CRP-like cAMP-binding protein
VLLTGSGDATARLWDMTSGEELFRWRFNEPTRAVKFSVGERMAALSTDPFMNSVSTIRLVNIAEHAEDQTDEVVHTLNKSSPRMHAGLLDKWQQALREADDWLAAINFGTARQRMCHFILRMRHTTDPSVVTLFSREDMGAMMDLKQETVSREISALVKLGALQPVDKLGRIYRIVDDSLLQSASDQ